MVPALNAARDLAVRGGMHFHFLSELDHLIATAKANTDQGLCHSHDAAIDLLDSGFCAVQAQPDIEGLSGKDVLAGIGVSRCVLANDLCCLADPI